jgi:hypothetical protein
MRTPLLSIRARMHTDIPIYRINHLLRGYTAAIKHDNAGREINNICLNAFKNDQILSPDGKKNQLMDQLISEAIIHFTTCAWEKNKQKIAGDLLGDLSGENGRRKPYGALI